EGQWFQIEAEHERLSLVDRKVTVRRLRSGAMQLLYGDKKLQWKALPKRAARVRPAPRNVGRIRLVKPEKDHPWRRRGMAAGREFWRAERARGSEIRRAQHPAAAAA